MNYFDRWLNAIKQLFKPKPGTPIDDLGGSLFWSIFGPFIMLVIALVVIATIFYSFFHNK